MGSDAVRNQPYPEDLHLPVDRTRPRPGPNQGFPRRQRLQLPSPRRPRHPHQPHQDRSLLRRLLRRPHQHRHFCSRSLLSTSTSTPTSRHHDSFTNMLGSSYQSRRWSVVHLLLQHRTCTTNKAVCSQKNRRDHQNGRNVSEHFGIMVSTTELAELTASWRNSNSFGELFKT